MKGVWGLTSNCVLYLRSRSSSRDVKQERRLLLLSSRMREQGNDHTHMRSLLVSSVTLWRWPNGWAQRNSQNGVKSSHSSRCVYSIRFVMIFVVEPTLDCPCWNVLERIGHQLHPFIPYTIRVGVGGFEGYCGSGDIQGTFTAWGFQEADQEVVGRAIHRREEQVVLHTSASESPNHVLCSWLVSHHRLFLVLLSYSSRCFLSSVCRFRGRELQNICMYITCSSILMTHRMHTRNIHDFFHTLLTPVLCIGWRGLRIFTSMSWAIHTFGSTRTSDAVLLDIKVLIDLRSWIIPCLVIDLIRTLLQLETWQSCRAEIYPRARMNLTVWWEVQSVSEEGLLLPFAWSITNLWNVNADIDEFYHGSPLILNLLWGWSQNSARIRSS